MTLTKLKLASQQNNADAFEYVNLEQIFSIDVHDAAYTVYLGANRSIEVSLGESVISVIISNADSAVAA